MEKGSERNAENGVELSEEELRKKEKHQKEEEEEELSIERIFENQEVPSWKKQLTIRAFAVSFMLSVMFSFIVMKLNLTTGIIPTLNISASFLGFFFVKTWTKLFSKSGMLKQPFTRQENTVIQTCVVASSGIAFSGGFGSYLLAMSERVFKISEEGKTDLAFKNPKMGWMIGFLLVVSFGGLFSLVLLKKVSDFYGFKLTWPS